MKPDPLVFSFRLEDFDLTKLPIDPAMLRTNRPMLEAAISDYYAEQFRPVGGDAQISIANGIVTVRWIHESGLESLVEQGVALLERGDYATAVPLLQSALPRIPDNPILLFNLGMALSDQSRLPEAIALLDRLVTLQPANARAWNALGVAHARQKDAGAAERALRRSLELDPNDGYGHRNLGSLVSGRSPEEGLKYFKRAAELLPLDQAAQYGYGFACFESGNFSEADPILKRAIEIAPLTQIAELARTARTRIAHANMRAAGGTAPRLDAVMYCLSALQLFAKSPEKLQAVTFEIAMLGRRGLDINDAAQKYTLNSLPGRFSGLHLVSYMYAGMRQFAPEMDPGIDLSREYAQATQLFDGGKA